jgi:hypothetical protein
LPKPEKDKKLAIKKKIVKKKKIIPEKPFDSQKEKLRKEIEADDR